MPNIKVGIIGAGGIAASGARGINGHECAEVVAACDLNSERLAKLCSEHQIGKAYSSATELLADPSIDAVYVALPNMFHAPVSLEALQAGKHVILDKPFALNLAEAEEVVAVAQRQGLVFMLGMNMRFRPDSQKIRSLSEQGVFGQIYHAKAYWCRRSGIPRLGTWFGNRAMAGGGCALDIGVHALDLCLYCMNNFDPVSITGSVSTNFGNRGLGEGGWGRSDRDSSIVFDVEDGAFALIRMRNGATVSLEATWACHTGEGNRNNVELFGSEGGASLYPSKVFRNDPLRVDYDVIENVKAPVPYPEDRFQHFIDVILGRSKCCVPMQESLVVQRLLDGLYESSQTGREVRFD